MHGEVRGVPGRADPDLVGRIDRCLEKKNCKHGDKDLFHFLPLGNQKPIQQSLIMYFVRSPNFFLLLLPQASRLVAVGTALASGPPHRSVLEGFPHTAPTSGYLTASRSIAACRTRHKPCDSLPRLCVRHECACVAFPSVDLLPSADSAANAPAPALFARFSGTMRPSDSLQTCMSTVRPLAFFDRPTLLSSVGVCRASRFPRMELPHMPRVSDSAVLKDRSRLTPPFMLPSPYQDKVGTPKW